MSFRLPACMKTVARVSTDRLWMLQLVSTSHDVYPPNANANARRDGNGLSGYREGSAGAARPAAASSHRTGRPSAALRAPRPRPAPRRAAPPPPPSAQGAASRRERGSNPRPSRAGGAAAVPAGAAAVRGRAGDAGSRLPAPVCRPGPSAPTAAVLRGGVPGAAPGAGARRDFG